MPSKELFPVPARAKRRAWIDERTYRHEYERSLRDPDGFWAEQAERLDWFRKPPGSGTFRTARTRCTSAGSRTEP
jgi:hypothetical protein